MRVAIDTNVFLSALLGGRGTRPILLALLDQRFKLLTSRTLFEELIHVTSRSEWTQLINPSERQDLFAMIQEAAVMVSPTHRVSVCRDPEDNAILECALAGHAEFIVTGDKDLLVLSPFRGIPILRPSDFLKHLF